MESWIPAVTAFTLCGNPLYNRATLHPMLICEVLGQKEMKNSAGLCFYFKRNLEHLQHMKEENWRRESKIISFVIMILYGNFSGMFV